MESELDVLIVGAGLSGVGAAYHLQASCPNKSYAILEARESMGGTWDLFRYPGIRSDSDMYTLGYSFRPWTGEKAIADGPSILKYICDTAQAYGIDRKVQYGLRVTSVSWSSQTARWTVQVQEAKSGNTRTFRCSFLFVCAGYYDYEQGYLPELAGRERFKGRIVHPQHWPADLSYEGKRVVIIGSGATAVTLLPELAKSAAHVTMLQRSPTYIVSAPEKDAIADWLRERLPKGSAYALTRLKNVTFGMAFYAFCRKYPERAKAFLLKRVQRQLPGQDVQVDFTPSYKPWDQRLCLVPNGDLFCAIRDGRASVVTDHIESFTEQGLRLRSGRELAADLVVTATGLKLKFLGGLALTVDGRRVEPSQELTYKGMMLSDVPNLAFALGYTNASWTLKSDLTSEYVCRLLQHMEKKGLRQCRPRRNDPKLKEEPILNFSSGYVQRALSELPKQGSRHPWKLPQNYALDRVTLRHSSLKDRAMTFSK